MSGGLLSEHEASVSHLPECIKDCIAAGLLTVLMSLVLFYAVPTYIDPPQEAEASALAPAFWPELVAKFALAACVLLLLLSLVRCVRASHVCRLGSSLKGELPPLGVMLWLALYGMAVAPLGLLPASLVFLPTTSFFYGERRPLVLLVLTISVLAVLHVFFVYVAQVPMPPGLLWS